jgi:hypothetical protein
VRGLSLIAICLLGTGQLAAQAGLHLKTNPRLESGIHIEDPSKRRSASRSHLLIQYPDTPTDNQLAMLADRGVAVLSYIPDFGFAAAADDGTSLEGLGVQWAGRLAAGDKISPVYGDSQTAVVEFFPDVDPYDARSIVLEAQLQIQEHPDLRPNHLLVAMSLDQARALAEWDEVAYVFPASDDLVQGAPVIGCAGALTSQGYVGQSVAKIGDGWDGPGRGSADLNYGFVHVTEKLPVDAVHSEFARALAEWSKYAAVNFTLTDRTDGNRTLAVLFASGVHGDAYPFDGPGGILAHTFYPFPVSPESIAGDLHFDADENWRMGADIDFFSVALHEIGHALGLGHSDQPGAVMYPYYRRHPVLTQEDIGAILELYAARGALAPLALTVSDPVSPTAVVVSRSQRRRYRRASRHRGVLEHRSWLFGNRARLVQLVGLWYPAIRGRECDYDYRARCARNASFPYGEPGSPSCDGCLASADHLAGQRRIIHRILAHSDTQRNGIRRVGHRPRHVDQLSWRLGPGCGDRYLVRRTRHAQHWTERDHRDRLGTQRHIPQRYDSGELCSPIRRLRYHAPLHRDPESGANQRVDQRCHHHDERHRARQHRRGAGDVVELQRRRGNRERNRDLDHPAHRIAGRVEYHHHPGRRPRWQHGMACGDGYTILSRARQQACVRRGDETTCCRYASLRARLGRGSFE